MRLALLGSSSSVCDSVLQVSEDGKGSYPIARTGRPNPRAFQHVSLWIKLFDVTKVSAKSCKAGVELLKRSKAPKRLHDCVWICQNKFLLRCSTSVPMHAPLVARNMQYTDQRTLPKSARLLSTWGLLGVACINLHSSVTWINLSPSNILVQFRRLGGPPVRSCGHPSRTAAADRGVHTSPLTSLQPISFLSTLLLPSPYSPRFFLPNPHLHRPHA